MLAEMLFAVGCCASGEMALASKESVLSQVPRGTLPQDAEGDMRQPGTSSNPDVIDMTMVNAECLSGFDVFLHKGTFALATP
mmetsp:Transcript_163616/g.314274  ORF Transcript_163616/g.314274 Transcript_163616/m.314274 type:complete len:82 (+) Transcript_163616:1435-1680(+)